MHLHPLWKMGWFVVGRAIEFLSCNDHLQLIATQCVSMGVSAIEQVTWVTMDVIHYMWNCIHMQLMLFNNNYVETTIVQL